MDQAETGGFSQHWRANASQVAESTEPSQASAMTTPIPRNTGFLQASPVTGPVPGQVQLRVDQGVPFRRHVSQIHPHLTVVDFPQASTSLPGHADRLSARLGKGGGIEDQHAVRFSLLRADVPGQFFTQWQILPLRFADEVLNRL